ncbi:MAG: hypothetical protein HBSIN02_09870 [Bacteroidia bacterium]|nr:MAG: hypothetical protein HBSIN02_09870 [Bacteroidia bacterium]
MMKTIVFAVFLFLALPIGAQAQTGKATKSQLVSTAVISVPTIQCNMCSMNVEDALQEVKGVESVEVNLKKKTVTVLYRPRETTLAGLEDAIVKAGYDANKKKADPEAYSKLDDCCKVPEEKKDGSTHP